MRTASPLRYPGGKWRVSRFFERLIELNFNRAPHYVEPYAGGASLALTLLFRGYVSRIFLNDLDPAIHAFWRAIMFQPSAFNSLIEKTPLTPREWHRQKAIYQSGREASVLELGFATFFLNRTSHSGILNAGMIGGEQQKGEWKIGARFNREDLVERVTRIAMLKDYISISGLDAADFLRQHQRRRAGSLIYFDPPYFKAGQDLYLNAYNHSDHCLVRDKVVSLQAPWVVSYDDAAEIRSLYREERSRRVTLNHTAREPRVGKEVMFFSDSLRIPRFVPYYSSTLA